MPTLTTLVGLIPLKLYVTPPIVADAVGFGAAVTDPEPSATSPALVAAVAPSPNATLPAIPAAPAVEALPNATLP